MSEHRKLAQLRGRQPGFRCVMQARIKIMVVLERESPLFGLEIYRRTLIRRWGSVYESLKRMENGGLVTSWRDGSHSGSGTRRMYKLTPLGEAELSELRSLLLGIDEVGRE